MTILVTGSRDWTDGRRIFARLSELPNDTTVIEGGAVGADYFARLSAHVCGMKVITVKANWLKYGKSAGPLRNREMLNMQPDRVIAFCKNNSRGTMDCVRAAMERDIPVEVINE